jgi:hypothetical protein
VWYSGCGYSTSGNMNGLVLGCKVRLSGEIIKAPTPCVPMSGEIIKAPTLCVPGD